MKHTTETDAFQRGVRPVMDPVLRAHSRFVLGYQPAPELRARIEELAEKSTEGSLTAAERDEYAGYVRANKFVAMLQRLARELDRAA